MAKIEEDNGARKDHDKRIKEISWREKKGEDGHCQT
jgi:hypothetical protein